MTYLSEDKNKRFLGDGSRNENGESLEEFLLKYDPSHYQTPSSTVDTAVFAYDKTKTKLKLLLIKRRNHPSIGEWALPGGFVEFDEDIDVTSVRELEEETGLTGIRTVQIGTYGAPDRDPRTRIITTLYAALVPADSINPQAGDDAKDAVLFDIDLEEERDSVKLILTSDQTDSTLEAIYKKIEIPDEFFSYTKYELISSHGIALDHELLILDAYMYIKKHLEADS